MEASETVSVGVIPSTFANITASKAIDGLFQGVSREEGRAETFVVRNDGNTVLNADLSAVLLDGDDKERTDWTVKISPSEITNLAIGEEVEVSVTLMPDEDVERGASRLVLSVSSEVYWSLPLSAMPASRSALIQAVCSTSSRQPSASRWWLFCWSGCDSRSTDEGIRCAGR